jgi:uncharacterized caspase-like protein
MNDWKRRRLIQAGLAAPLLRWGPAGAQTPDRNLTASERKPAAAAQSGASLLIAPRRALVIGNGNYGFGPLKNPANDARAIAEELKRAGFEVTVVIDQGRSAMLDAIGKYGESLASSKAIGVFYFAGHGVQLAWRNYLLPTDAQIARIEDIKERCVDVNAVIEGIAKAANPMNVVILDACRENPFGGDVKPEQRGLSQLDAPPGTLLAYATAPGNLASDGDGANGLYTEQLLKELKVPEAKIEDVFKRVRLTVRRRSNGQQIPWESTSLEEDFWFIPPKEMQKLATAEADRVRKEKEVERLWQERIEKAQREEADRLRREAESARARQEADERRRREQIERAYQEEQERRRKQERSDRAYEDELKFWERVARTTEPGPLEDYLRRYPSGRFCEIAQAQLDRLLARMGEQKIEIVQQAQNPYTQGTATANTSYKVGDSYTYNSMDAISKVVQGTVTETITRITDTEVIYDDGKSITDLLGNPLRLRDGRTWTANQTYPNEFVLGKRWGTRFTMNEPRSGSANREFEFRIAAKERITVPAGTFDTFRIEGHGGGMTPGGAPMTSARKIWLAPNVVRRPIAEEGIATVAGRFIGRAGRQELVSFRPA